MATNIQMNIKKSSGSYDILYPQTTAGQIASGTLSTDRIPSLPASKITEGTFSGTKTGEYIFPGNVRVGGTGSSSNAKIRIGDSDYVYLHEDSDDNLTIKAKRIEFTTSSSPGITNNGVAIGGGAPNVSSATGTLSIAHGGTGATTASAAIYGLTNGLSTRSASSINSYPSSTYIPCYYSTTGYKFPISNLLTYIQNNVSSGGGSINIGYKSYTGTGYSQTTQLYFSNIGTTLYAALVAYNNGPSASSEFSTRAMYSVVSILGSSSGYFSSPSVSDNAIGIRSEDGYWSGNNSRLDVKGCLNLVSMPYKAIIITN